MPRRRAPLAFVAPAAATLGLAVACTDLGGLSDAPPGTDASVDGAPNTDGGDGGADAAPTATACAWDAPFTTVRAVSELNVSTDTGGASLSEDERVVHYQVRSGTTFDFYRASRADRGAPFGPGAPEVDLSDPAWNDTNASVSPDGLLAVFASDRGGDAGTDDLYAAKRATTGTAFSVPSRLVDLGVLGSTVTPHLTADAKELWFSIRGVTATERATYVSAVTSGAFGAATARPDVPGWAPVLSADKLTIYFAAGASSGTNALRVAHRDSALGAFPPASVVSELNVGGETPSWLSADQCRLYFTTRRNVVAEIWIAERTP